MSCLRLEHVYRFLENELGSEEKRMVKNHLESCPACSRAVEARRAIHEASTTLPPLEIPPDFAEQVMARIPSSRIFLYSWPAALAMGFVTLFLAFAGVYLLTGQSLVGFLTSINHTVLDFLKQTTLILGKIVKIIMVVLNLVGDFIVSLGKGLEVLSSLLRPDIIAAGLLLGLALSFLFIYGMKRIFSFGGKP